LQFKPIELEETTPILPPSSIQPKDLFGGLLRFKEMPLQGNFFFALPSTLG
jgi:hypothetical protein